MEILTENARIYALDEECLLRGDVYGYKLYKELINAARRLQAMREQVGVGETVNDVEYWETFDSINCLSERILITGRSPFELSQR